MTSAVHVAPRSCYPNFCLKSPSFYPPSSDCSTAIRPTKPVPLGTPVVCGPLLAKEKGFSLDFFPIFFFVPVFSAFFSPTGSPAFVFIYLVKILILQGPRALYGSLRQGRFPNERYQLGSQGLRRLLGPCGIYLSFSHLFDRRICAPFLGCAPCVVHLSSHSGDS